MTVIVIRSVLIPKDRFLIHALGLDRLANELQVLQYGLKGEIKTGVVISVR